MVFHYANITYAQSTTEDITNITTITEHVFAPLRIATDQFEVIYITDAFNKSILKYDASGNFLETINVGVLPISVAVNSKGELFIGDGETGNILKYDEILGVSEFYTKTKYPNSMVFSSNNVLYVTDSKLQQVVAIDISGNVVQTIGSGILDFPTGIAFDNNNKRILVGEHGGSGWGFKPVVKVWMFDLQGSLIKSFGSHGNGDGQFYRVQGVTVGKCGNIYVVDPYLGSISIFDENGVYITKFGEWGDQPGQLNIPMDIVFDSQERLIVTSMNNGALEVFGITNTLPCSNIKSESAMICDGESTDIEIAFTGTAPWIFTYSIDGIDMETITANDNPYILSTSEPGHYNITSLFDANFEGTCFTGSADVTVSSVPPTSEISGDAALCEGDTADLSIAFTGSAPWTFTYTKDGINPTTIITTNNPYLLKVTEAGQYEVISLKGGGCSGTEMIGSADILVNPLPTASITNGNGQILIGAGETAGLSVALTGTPPWNITYTVDDLNPTTIFDIAETPYIIQVSEEGTYEVKEVSDVNCSNSSSFGYPEIIIFSPPVAVDDNANTQDGVPVIINVTDNDYDNDGEINSSTVNIIDYPLTGGLEVSPDGTVTYTPGQESCGQETFTYTVADNSSYISNTATVVITITDITPPEFTDIPDDLTVSCISIPEPAIVAARDNCDFEVTIIYLGETRDNNCDMGYYTLTRTWSATDKSGNSTNYSQSITVGTRFKAGCFSVNLISSEYFQLENYTTYIWELYDNNCEKELSYITFEMPDGIIAQELITNTVYNYPDNSYEYLVANPTGNPKKGSYGIKFSTFGERLSNGGPEVFVYSLPGEIQMNEVKVKVKSGKNEDLVLIPVIECACSRKLIDELALKSQKITLDVQSYGSSNLKVYPNPFTSRIFFEFQSPLNAHARLEVFDIRGVKLKTLFDNNLVGGQYYKVEYLPETISNGMYFYKMIIGNKIFSGKVNYLGK